MLRFYYYGVPCLSLSTSNHSLAPFILRISGVVGTRCLTQQCICLHFNTCLLFLLCFVVLENHGLTVWSHWTASKSCIDINRVTISVQYDAGWPYHDNPWLLTIINTESTKTRHAPGYISQINLIEGGEIWNIWKARQFYDRVMKFCYSNMHRMTSV